MHPKERKAWLDDIGIQVTKSRTVAAQLEQAQHQCVDGKVSYKAALWLHHIYVCIYRPKDMLICFHVQKNMVFTCLGDWHCNKL